ncbi:MAG: tRNA lysidine(34) synthetase TilS [Gammaproteobacteria bacterium]|nr:tRNA lysidine(34) synthetase TilS [Gammaproteobacteria bacterium]NIR98661.1 tRNA lysidine(34) synthetase TilS [Gammaproteobacteria bacterium]NIT64375.1 tRNA lysidine(34) synthetase TilS [Gammaproteobacteria bacterium]NIV21307.1 tRNA lysidine(34) synthetase TilS [Gammaproteobacteria bacterium]NIX11065.1 tRNA lysidine(34) synthetase TilS [Gammaproteobacteria bacterium]
MSFSPDQLLSFLHGLPPVRRYWVAYSGGADSHVLLHAMAGLGPGLGAAKLRAVHVHHGLHPDADRWTDHCRAVCEALGVALDVVAVDARARRGQSPEAAARAARYRVLAERVGPAECLLTAHHMDDQAETVLLQLMRGAGPGGLAAMPRQRPCGAGLHVRPLLDQPRAALRAYAASHGLRWIEDTSNTVLDLDRNFLRHEVLPRLAVRWPALAATVSRSAAHCAETGQLADALAGLDLAAVRVPGGRHLSVSGLRGLDMARRRNAVRAWLRGRGFTPPSTVCLTRALHDLLGAAWDATPRVCWAGAELRRYRDGLYVMTPVFGHDPGNVLRWDLSGPLALPGLPGRLVARAVRGAGLRRSDCDRGTVTVRFRQGGERCRPPGAGHRRTLKNLFQERGVPPWRRDRVPLVYIDDVLAAVVGYWLCEPFAARGDEPAYAIDWEGGDDSPRTTTNIECAPD